MVTDTPITIHGIRHIHYKCDGQDLVIPFYACDVKYPTFSHTTTWLRFPIDPNNQPYYLQPQPFSANGQIWGTDLPPGRATALWTYMANTHAWSTKPKQTQSNHIAPTSFTADGTRRITGGNTDYWVTQDNYVTRSHKRKRRAKFTPENTKCPVPTEQLEAWRQTTARRAGLPDQTFTDNYPNVTSKKQRRLQRRPLDRGNSVQDQGRLQSHNYDRTDTTTRQVPRELAKEH